MTYRIETPDTLPDLDALEDILREYLGHVLATLTNAGGPPFAVDDLMADTLADLDAYLPPRGRSFLVRDATGALVAIAFVRMASPDAAEMKRLYVRPSGRGRGLGRQLTERAIAAARALGASDLYLDTVADLAPARALYEGLGFDYVDRYPASQMAPALDPWLVFMRRRL